MTVLALKHLIDEYQEKLKKKQSKESIKSVDNKSSDHKKSNSPSMSASPFSERSGTQHELSTTVINEEEDPMSTSLIKEDMDDVLSTSIFKDEEGPKKKKKKKSKSRPTSVNSPMESPISMANSMSMRFNEDLLVQVEQLKATVDSMQATLSALREEFKTELKKQKEELLQEFRADLLASELRVFSMLQQYPKASSTTSSPSTPVPLARRSSSKLAALNRGSPSVSTEELPSILRIILATICIVKYNTFK
jgi:hypothetical protein